MNMTWKVAVSLLSWNRVRHHKGCLPLKFFFFIQNLIKNSSSILKKLCKRSSFSTKETGILFIVSKDLILLTNNFSLIQTRNRLTWLLRCLWGPPFPDRTSHNCGKCRGDPKGSCSGIPKMFFVAWYTHSMQTTMNMVSDRYPWRLSRTEFLYLQQS